MRKLMLAAVAGALMSSAAIAQTATPPTPNDPATPAIATPDSTNPKAPVAGANSFTEEQARTRIENAGYASVTALVKDETGIWRGKATKDGAPVDVALDFQGNVVGK